MLRAFGIPLALVALLFITGMHLAILQSVASVRMVANFSRTQPFAESLAKTMDGEHPCSLCLQIRKTRGEETKKSEALGFSQKKSEAALLALPVQLPSRTSFRAHFESFSEITRVRSYLPGLRPPRSV